MIARPSRRNSPVNRTAAEAYCVHRREFDTVDDQLIAQERPLTLWQMCRRGHKSLLPLEGTGEAVSVLCNLRGAVDERYCLKILTGVATDLAEHLRRSGADVTIKDHRTFRAPSPEAGMFGRGGWGINHHELLRVLPEHPLGRLEVSGMRDAITSAAVLCRYYSGFRIVLPRPSRKRVVQTEAKLRDLGVLTPRTHVCLYEELRDFKVSQVDVLVLLDTSEIERKFARERLELLVHTKFDVGFRGRIYGFLPKGLPRTRWSELDQARYCGPVIRRLESKRREVRVVWVDYSLPHETGNETTALERKRVTLWSNDARNDLIAEIADAVAKQAGPQLKRFGIPHPYTMTLRIPGEVQPLLVEPSVAILVENELHGRQLMNRLRGGVLVTQENVAESPMQKYHQTGVILTQVAAANYTPPLDVLVRATEHDGRVNIKGFPERLWDDMPPSLLIDLRDTFTRGAQRATRRRRREYVHVGWDGA